MTASVTTYGRSVGIRELVGQAWRNLRERAPELWPLLLPWTAAAILNGELVHAAKLSGQESPFSALNLGRVLVGALTAAILSGVAVRTLLGRGRAAWRPDPELGAYVALTMLIQLFTSFSDVVPHAVQASQGQALEHLGEVIVFGFGSLWLIARLTLWPIAQLMGERRASAFDSMRRMRGAVWTYWIATLLAIAPPLMVGAALDWPYVRHGQVAGLLLSAPFFAAAALAGAAVEAEIFRARWLRD